MTVETARMPGNLFIVGHHDQSVGMYMQAHNPVGVRGWRTVAAALEMD